MTGIDDNGWILLSEAVALVGRGWRNGFGLLGGVADRERILRWLADERLTARADELVEYVVVEPTRPEPPAPPAPADTAPSADPLAEAIRDQVTYRTVFSGNPIPRSQWPLERIERCHIHMQSEIFAYHDLRQHPIWDENELTISVMDGTQARAIFYGIRLNRADLLRKAGLPDDGPVARAPAPNEPARAATDRPAMRAPEKDIIEWVTAQAAHGSLPRVAGPLFAAAREHFEQGRNLRITREMLDSAIQKAGFARAQGRRDLPEDGR